MKSTTVLNAAQALPLFSGLSEVDTSALLTQGTPSSIASRLGIEPETFSRTLKELRSHGLNVQGNQVSITPDLDQYVCEACSVMDHCETRSAMQGKAVANKPT